MGNDSFTCGECGERTSDDNHSSDCEGSIADRFRRLTERIEELEAMAPRLAYKAIINPTDAAPGDRTVGYYEVDEAARAAVEGKDYYGSNGRVRDVTVIVDSVGNVFELSPSWLKLTPS